MKAVPKQADTQPGADSADSEAAPLIDVIAAADTADTTDTSDTSDTTDTATAPDVAELGADATSCACGDGQCDPGCDETLASCPADCRSCGDGVCSPGESPTSCPTDCCGGCGDGLCKGYACGENPTVCPADCGKACGNKVCDKGESPATCATDCVWQVCGNGVCEPEDGGPKVCPNDCGPTCGNCVCEGGENWTDCPGDCGFCGDHVCSNCTGLGESNTTCPSDCKIDGCGGGCDDGVACTVDVCGSTGVCVHVIDDAVCSDGNVCTIDACVVAAKGCSAYSVSGPACDDGDACFLGDYCVQGACHAGAPKVCNDGNGCTDDSCGGGVCLFAANTATCNDGDGCTLSDACTETICAGVPKDCTDGAQCTFDSCGIAGCKHIPDPAKCDDDQICTSDTCTSDGCQHMPNSNPCDDGDPCTLGDKCNTGGCVAGTPMKCADGNGCTTDYCWDGVCLFSANTNTCNDSNPCTLADACTASTCVGTAQDCDDGLPCTADACSPNDGKCKYALDSTACDDGNVCTADVCALSVGCTNSALDGLACTDDDVCTIADHCGGGACIHTPLPCDDNNACTNDACGNPGGCTHANVAAGAACGTGGACVADVCTCPDNSIGVQVDDAGANKLVCAYDYPAWGRRSLNPVFVDNGDGSVSDPQTGLQWQADVELNAKWGDAAAKCQQLVFVGHADWRLPTEAELETLIVYDANAAQGSFAPGWPGATQHWSAVFSGNGSMLWSLSPSAGYIPNMYWTMTHGYAVLTGTWQTDSSQLAAFRCVRTQSVLPPVEPRWVPVAQGGVSVVYDGATHLLWQASVAQKMGVGSIAYCEGIHDLGATWAVPNASDAASIVDRRGWNSAVPAPFADGEQTMLTTTFLSATAMLSVSGMGGSIGTADQWALTRCVGQCDDHDPCTVDATFDPVEGCVHTPVNENGPCGDIGTCTAGICTCPAGTLRQILDPDGATKIVCAYNYPAWGIGPATPVGILANDDGGESGPSTVSDAATGLMWQHAAQLDKLALEWTKLYCDRIEINGLADWRVPTMAELQSIRDYGAQTVAGGRPIDPTVFDIAPGAALWTRNTTPGKPAPLLWGSGEVGTVSASFAANVLCVRTEKQVALAAPHLVLTSVGTIVHDHVTGRLWQKYLGYPPTAVMPPYVTLPEAQSACTALTEGGATWHVASIREMLSTLTANSAPMVDPLLMPTVYDPATFWSLTESGDTSYLSYFAIQLYPGAVFFGMEPANTAYVACVGSCDDGDSCTADSFDDTTGCVHAPLPADGTCPGP